MKNHLLLSQKSPYLKLYDHGQIFHVLEEILPGYTQRETSQSEKSLLALAQKLAEKSPYRLLRGTYQQHWATIEGFLMKSFPHFEAVIEIIRDAWHLAYHSQTSLQIPPLLLLGDPGLGKTYFAASLARLLGTEYRYIPLATTSAGFVLSGMNMTWSDAKPGILFTHLLQGEQGNPLMLLDEIDKASSGHTHDSLAPLYGLLERHTAREFKDEYFPIPFNTAHVQWMATANTLDYIPEPIQSRMQLITIRHPTLDERVGITRMIYDQILNDQPWGEIFDPILDRGLHQAIAETCKTPREIRKTLERICGSTATAYKEDGLENDPFQELRPTLKNLPVTRKPEKIFGFRTPEVSGERRIQR